MSPLVLASLAAIFIVSAVAVPSTSSSSSSSSSRSSSASSPTIVDGSYSYYPYDSQGSYDSAGVYSATGSMGDTYLRDWNHQEWAKLSGRMHQPKCVDIPRNLSLCQNIGYDKMMLPNLLDHDSLGEVSQQASSWVHLVNINCHPDLKVFLCSLFSPVCLDKIIYPCRTLCSSVKASCETRMKTYGFDWPDMLACNQYPEDNDMCIKLIHDVKPDNNCSACRHPLTFESLIDHYCRADVVMRATIRDIKNLQGDSHLVLRKKKKFFKTGQGMSRQSARNLKVIIEGGASCTCDTVNTTDQRYLIMGAMSGDKLKLNFAILWDRKNEEFKKGMRAIRKRNTCEGIFNELSNNGSRLDPTKSTSVSGTTGRRGKSGRKGRKVGRRGKRVRKNRKGSRRPRLRGKERGSKKPRKSSSKGKRKSGRKGRTGRNVRKGKGRRGKKNQSRSDKEQPTSQVPAGTGGLTRSEIEDRALSNFRRASE